jgi:redox-sensitive bicupin YhaK (pirin superfamily)
MPLESISTLVKGHPADLGAGFTVLRVVPQAALRSVGPFVFVDHMGPVDFQVGQGIDVRPHPHIGLATLTWLFDGGIVHRDSLGTVQPIAPGDVNWMVAGRGIVHSERTAPAQRALPQRLHGMQTWLALPAEHEDDAPAFEHHPAATLPLIERAGARVRVIAGTAFGARSPVAVRSPTLYCELQLATDARFVLTAEHAQRAVYVVSGAVDIDGQQAGRGTLALLEPGLDVTLTADPQALVMLLGGAPVGPRHLFWNFVASSRERIDAARADWEAHGDPARWQGDARPASRFAPVPGEHEFIPLPRRPAPTAL